MSPRHHRLVRLLALLVTVGSLFYVTDRLDWRRDLTAEGLSRLSPQTLDIVDEIDEAAPIVVTAYVSAEVPRQFVAVRQRLLNILRELDARGGERVELRLHAPENHSEQAQEAIENFGIEPRSVFSEEGGRVAARSIFLGFAVQSGPREQVVPFVDRGLSVEYELARAIRAVTSDQRRVIGIVRDDSQLLGGFDLAAGGQLPEWRIVRELRKQYEVKAVDPASPVPATIDVLLVPQVSSLSPDGLEHVAAHVTAGKPALIVADPMPAFDVRLAPSEPLLPPPGVDPRMAGPSAEKGEFGQFLRSIGVDWAASRVVFDLENPNPQLQRIRRHYVFVGKRSDGSNPFAEGDAVVEGLAQVLTLYGGHLRQTELSGLEFTPLLTTGTQGGFDEFETMVDRRNPFRGLQGPRHPARIGRMTGEPITLGARVRRSGAGTPADPSVDAIVLADLDMFADTFFAFHERGGDIDGDGLVDVRLDNVTFLLNAIDVLAGDEGFVELRGRQPRFRRLETVDRMTAAARSEREAALVATDEAAEKAIEAAETRLKAAVEAIQAEPGLDEKTRRTRIIAAEDVENRRLAREQERIERENRREIARIEKEHLRAVDEVQNRIRLAAILLPPIPALLLGLFIFGRQRQRQRAGTPVRRKRGAA